MAPPVQVMQRTWKESTSYNKIIKFMDENLFCTLPEKYLDVKTGQDCAKYHSSRDSPGLLDKTLNVILHHIDYREVHLTCIIKIIFYSKITT